MKLLLTSTGISTPELATSFARDFPELLDKKLALIFTVRTPEDLEWISHYHQELAGLGLEWEDVNISEDRDWSRLGIGSFDGYYVCWGNTFHILDRLKKTGLFSRIREEVVAGKPYIGVSAGSIIAGKDIEIAGWGPDGDENDTGMSDFSGMDISRLVVSPHYSDDDEEGIREFEGLRKVFVKRLRDGESILVIR